METFKLDENSDYSQQENNLNNYEQKFGQVNLEEQIS